LWERKTKQNLNHVNKRRSTREVRQEGKVGTKRENRKSDRGVNIIKLYACMEM
jgi:hypothetical protein